MPKNSQRCDVRTAESMSAPGDVLRVQLPTLRAVTKSKPCRLSQASQPTRTPQAAAVLL